MMLAAGLCDVLWDSSRVPYKPGFMRVGSRALLERSERYPLINLICPENATLKLAADLSVVLDSCDCV